MARRLRPGHHRLLFMLGIACAAGIAGVLGYRAVFVQGQIDRTRTALTALCILRHDLDVRIKASHDFLNSHPRGIDGISVNVIRQGLQASERTRTALNVLACK